MKTFTNAFFKTGILALLIAGFLVTGCDDNSDIDSISKQDDEFTALELIEIDAVTEGVDAIIENVLTSFEKRNELFKGGDTKYNDYLPECVSITKTITQTSRRVEVDFGTEGCALPNGDVLKGKILVEFMFNTAAGSIEITYGFDNFYYNDKKIEGTVNKVKVRMNENGNPETIHTKNISITWEDGTYVEVSGERTRELIEGFGTMEWADKVFSITGNWTIKRRDGKVYSAVIIEPLIRKLSCRFIVSGTVSIERDNVQMLLDYGDGTCDDLATITVNGVTKEIHLGQRNTDAK